VILDKGRGKEVAAIPDDAMMSFEVEAKSQVKQI